MNAPIIIPDQPGSRDNLSRPFKIEGMDVRGRAVRLGTVADQIIHAHDYPDVIARLIGELAALAALLGSMMKYDGVITIQAKAKGTIRLLVADVTTQGVVRAYADYDAEKLALYGKDPSFSALTRGGYLAITIDQGDDMERYQGIVSLVGENLAACAIGYFRDSEQTPTALKIAAGRAPLSGTWRAGGIMVQHLARGEDGGPRLLNREEQEAWNRASLLMETVQVEELLDPDLDIEQLLFRLYHEDGVRVYDPVALRWGCRCSRDRIGQVLASFPAEDLTDMVADSGKIEVTCQFCNSIYQFDP